MIDDLQALVRSGFSLLLNLNSHSHPLAEMRPCLCQMSRMKSCCLLQAEQLRLAGSMGRCRKGTPKANCDVEVDPLTDQLTG